MLLEWHSENSIIIFFSLPVNNIFEYALFHIKCFSLQYVHNNGFYVKFRNFFHDFFSAFLRCFMSTKNMKEIIQRKSKAITTSNRKSRKSTRRTIPVLCSSRFLEVSQEDDHQKSLSIHLLYSSKENCISAIMPIRLGWLIESDEK